MPQPSLNSFFDELCSRYDVDRGALESLSGRTIGIVVGTNPPYNVANFLSIYPKFGGVPLTPSCTFTAGSAVATLTSTAGIAAGQPVSSATGNVAAGTLIQSVYSTTQITLTNAAAHSGSQLLTIFTALFRIRRA